MNVQRVNLQRRSYVVSGRYCPRCLTRTDRLSTPLPLRLLRHFAGLQFSVRSCRWCGWEGLRRH